MSRLSTTIRDAVKQRAIDNRCEYCKLPESLSKYSHQVDHIFPPRHGGSDDIDNLAWACFKCNNHKGTDIATIENGKLIPLFNPRTKVWAEHFETQATGIIVGLTLEGEATVRLLNMNTIQYIEIRKNLIEIGIW